MQPLLLQWRFDPPLILTLAASALLYLRGWLFLRRERPHKYTPERLSSFLAGLALILIALASPLDVLASKLLSAHMIQHLLLLMAAPPLIWAGQPVIPLMRGLPAGVLKDAVGPFLQSSGLRRFAAFLVHPLTCFLFFAVGLNFWHLPKFYELALASFVWHRVEHLTFLLSALLFWWPVIGVWPAKPVWPRWTVIPYLALAEMAMTPVSAWLVFSTHVAYSSYGAGKAALDDQVIAGALMWVPGSIVILITAFVITMQLVSRPAASAPLPQRVLRRERFDWMRLPVLRWRHFPRVPQSIALVLAVFVMYEGFRNRPALALPLPWVYWRGLIVLALLCAGSLFCFSCPFRLVRDVVRRFIRPRWKWPAALCSGWFPAALLGVYLWVYEAFALWDSAWLTASLIAGYFAAIVVVDSLFEGATFCRYVCPAGRFQSAASLNSPLQVAVYSPVPCESCNTHDCLRSCDMQLYLPVKQGNYDCTFCMKCIPACPSNNIGLFPILPTSVIPRRHGASAVLGVFTAAALVSAAVMTDPVMKQLHRLPHALTLVYLLGLAGLPALARLLTGRDWKKFAFALAPLGFAMWLAHFSGHFNGALNLLSPDSTMALQLLALDGGLLFALRTIWKEKRVLRWAPVAVAFYAVCVWVLFQPMQMRGMVMKW